MSIPVFRSTDDFKLRQESSGRYLDAHENEAADYSVVTRSSQSNDTQRWKFEKVADVYTIQQRSSGRFLDAHEDASRDFSVVTRPAQDNATQKWLHFDVDTENAPPNVPGAPPGPPWRRFRQLSSGRLLDAYENEPHDFSAVTRPKQNDDTQWWDSATWSLGESDPLTQKSSGRRLDAHENQAADFSAVTRPFQANLTQLWKFELVGRVYAIKQKSSGRFLDAHEDEARDFSVVTRPAQNNDTQWWMVESAGTGSTGLVLFTLRQLSNLRYLDAHDSSNDMSAVTREAQGNDTQRWRIFDV